MRELDERRGFSELIQQHLTDSRGKNTQLPLADLLRQSVSEEWVGKASVLGFWDFLAAAEKALQSKTWLEHCILRPLSVHCRAAGKSERKFRVRAYSSAVVSLGSVRIPRKPPPIGKT